MFAIFQSQVFLLSTLFKFGFSQSSYQLSAHKDPDLEKNLFLFHLFSFILLVLLLSLATYLSELYSQLDNIYLVIAAAFMISFISVEAALKLPHRSPLTVIGIEDTAPAFFSFCS